MDTEELLPRLLLVGGLTAAVILYSRRRAHRAKQVTGGAATVSQAASDAAAKVSTEAPDLVARGQSMLESVLDNVAEQALRELKTVLKDGLKKLEGAVDSL